MSESFYKYLVDNILVNFFAARPAKKGDHYKLIIEDDIHRKGIVDALHSSPKSSSFMVSGIYEGPNTNPEEDYYETSVLKIDDHSTQFIIGDVDSANNYLPTIRNSVNDGRKYCEYATLFIIANDDSLDTVDKATFDLQAPGFPFDAHEVSSVIRKTIESTADITDNEREYLKEYLARTVISIDNSSSSLFDFEDILAVLQAKSLQGKFNALEYFNDDSIYEVLTLDPPINQRIKLNPYYYEVIGNIMSNLDEDSRKVKLSKYFDDKLVKRILDAPHSWRGIDFADILKSIEIKQSTADLLVDDDFKYFVDTDELLDENVIKRIIGKNKKTNTHLIICTSSPKVRVRVAFNKAIKDYIEAQPGVSFHDRYLYIDVDDTFVHAKVGKNDNIHDFYIKKLPVSIDTFQEIKNCFKFTAKGVILISIPDDKDTIQIGYGDNEINPCPSDIQWDEHYKLLINVINTSDSVVNQSIVFSATRQQFSFKIASDAIQNKTPLDFFEMIWKKKKSFYDNRVEQLFDYTYSVLSNGEEEYSTKKDFRELLLLEHQMVNNDAFNILNADKGHGYVNEELCIDDSIKSVLCEITAYYRSIGTIPSLTYIDETLIALYEKYLLAVKTCVDSIPTNRKLTPSEHAISRLGVVEMADGKVWLSPLHPICISFILEFRQRFDTVDYQSKILQLISPNYLIPFITINSAPMRPRIDSFTELVKTWVCYESVDSKEQNHAYNITTKMVKDKIEAFTKYFDYLFQNKDCPVIINTFGVTEDSNIIKGIIQYIITQYSNKQTVQRIEIHEYVDELLKESFYEKLNRLGTDDLIKQELDHIGQKIDAEGKYTSREIIHQLFTRIDFFKHRLDKNNLETISYSHISFYQMDTGCSFIKPNTNELRTELSLGGLISIPSTYNTGAFYEIGYGTRGVIDNPGVVYDTASLMNIIYANEADNGMNQFSNNCCLAKKYAFNDELLLKTIYYKSNWVTFLNPEVDIDFFYKQDLYIVHYTDQYTINAKYDSITVTKHIDRYQSLLMNAFSKSLTSKIDVNVFNKNMLDYFNCLNGSWLLDVVKKQEFQVQEKVSIVATVIAMLKFLGRNSDYMWIPISLDEILRVSKSVGLPQDYIFSVKSLGSKGIKSDDLLMIGIKPNLNERPQVIFYPIEVKYSKKDIHTVKGESQVMETYNLFRQKLFGSPTFVKMVYRTFFASQFLSNVDKFHANNLLPESDYLVVDHERFSLLNGKFDIVEGLPIEEMGFAGLVTFNSAGNSMRTEIVNDVPVCHINFNTDECLKFIGGTNEALYEFINSDISISPEDLETIKSLRNRGIEQISSEAYIETDPEDLVELPPIDNADINEQENVDETSQINDVPETHSEQDADDQEKELITVDDDIQLGIKLSIGEHKYTHAPIFFEPNNTSVVTHPNLGIIGTMGTGKTQFARSIIAQFSKESAHNVNQTPIGMLVFDYKGDYNDNEFLETVNGECFDGSFPFNPLTLVINDKVKKLNLPSITAERISDSLAKAFNLGNVQRNSVKEAIMAAYADAGIYANPDTWTRPVPTMQRVVDKYFEEHDAKDTVYGIFSTLRDYPMFTDDNSQCVSLFKWLNGVKVIDLTIYEDSVKKLIVSLILDLFYAEMKQWGGSDQKDGFRELRAMILVDEAHQFLKMKFNSLRKIISEGRMFGVGMILSTQNLSDFKSDEDYTQFISSWIIHNVNNVTKSEVASIFGGGDPNIESYISFISKAMKFESLCKIGHQTVQMIDLPYYKLVQSDTRFIK